jgi:hypothetical protein
MADVRSWCVPHANGRCPEGTHVTFPIGRPRGIPIERPGELGRTDADTAVPSSADWSIVRELPIFQKRPRT